MSVDFDEARVRATLTAERERLLADIARLKSGDRAAFPEAPQDDLTDLRGDEAEQAEPLTDAESNQDIVDVLSAELARVDAALGRLNDGTLSSYLSRGGKPIDPERLATHPWLLYDMDADSTPPARDPSADVRPARHDEDHTGQ